MNGKGDKQRPKNISDEEMESNWRRIFGAKKPCIISKPKHKNRLKKI